MLNDGTLTLSELIIKLQELESQGLGGKGVYFETYGIIEIIEYNEKLDRINIDLY